MRITGLRYERVQGTFDYDGPLGEAHHTRPIEIYAGYRDRRIWYPFKTEPHAPPYPIDCLFVHIDTDEGVTGTWRMTGMPQARLIQNALEAILIGENPLATERIWDKMYRLSIHGRKGETMMAMSVVDLALWDLKGCWFGVPTYQLLGGPSRDRIRAYASMLGYSLDPEDVAERSRQMVALGYTGLKWFFDCAPADGPKGVRRNLEMIRAAREAVGPDVDLMFDAWNSWDVPYTQRMAELAAPYRPRWFEEPVMADMIPQYAELRRTVSSTAIAGGEHEYTRWGAKALLDAGAVDVLQLDPTWAGGLTEMTKVCAMASAYGVPAVPHCGGRASTHLIASQTLTTCPIQEHLIQFAITSQYFFKRQVEPINGTIPLPTEPGLDMELDESRIESREELVLV